MNRKHLIQQFAKGINQRFSDYSGDPSRLLKLQNARLSKRGATLEVSRIKGYVIKNTIDALDIDKLLDIVVGPNDDIFLVYETSIAQNYRVTILDTTNLTQFTAPSVLENFDLATTNEPGKLSRLGETIYISGSNEMINYISGSYYLNQTVPNYPIFVSSGAIA